MAGRLGSIRFAKRKERLGLADLDVEATLFDPLNQVQFTELLYTAAETTPAIARPNPDGSWPALPSATSVRLKLNQEIASAALQVPLSGLTGRRLIVQGVCHLAPGRVVCSAPMPYEIPNKTTDLIALDAEPRPSSPVGSFELLGPLIDPLKQTVKDCELRKSGSTLTIQVPPGVRLLSPELGAKSSAMALVDVEGDFIAQVKVTGNMVPGTDPPRWRGMDSLPGAYQGAGLILWQDPKNYVRLERSARTARNRVALSSETLLEIVKSGRTVAYAYPPVPEGPHFVRIQRFKGALSLMYGSDGKQWNSHPKLAVVFPDKVQVGLVASNMSKQPLLAQFEDLELMIGHDISNEAK
jgi:regulation of enolase protein 1 (concanavalin A-like superfamily)